MDIRQDDTLESVLLQLKNYAHDHSLTGEQIGDIFHAGIIASSKQGILPSQIPTYHDDNLPGIEI